MPRDFESGPRAKRVKARHLGPVCNTARGRHTPIRSGFWGEGCVGPPTVCAGVSATAVLVCDSSIAVVRHGGCVIPVPVCYNMDSQYRIPVPASRVAAIIWKR